MKVVISYIIIIFFLFGIVTNGHLLRIDNAFGDGLFMEQLSASLGDRAADLLIKMDPPIVTTETIKDKSQKPTVEFKLFDSKTNQTFKEVTYYITIQKDGKTLLSDWFFNPDGDLYVEMQPKNQNHISVYGELDPILNAYASRGEFSSSGFWTNIFGWWIV